MRIKADTLTEKEYQIKSKNEQIERQKKNSADL